MKYFTAKNALIALVFTIAVVFIGSVVHQKAWAYTTPSSWTDYSYSEGYSEYSTEYSYEDWYGDETCDADGNNCSGSFYLKIGLTDSLDDSFTWDQGGYWSDFYDDADFGFWGFDSESYEVNLQNGSVCDENDDSYCA